MSDERFARQYRFGLPPGFPLASSCTSIVHHLSGPSIGALARQRGGPTSLGLPCARFTRLGQYSVSLRVGVCHPNTRTHVRLLGPCFKTGRISPAKRHDPGRAALRKARGAPVVGSPRLGARPCSCHARGLCVARLVAGPGPIVPASGGARPPRQSRIDSLASNDFTYYFTFFSKSFSSFPHGTCLLSVSSRYLALDENYRPFSAPVPKYATLIEHTVRAGIRTKEIRDSHPL